MCLIFSMLSQNSNHILKKMLILFIKLFLTLFAFGLPILTPGCHGSHSSIRVSTGYKGVVIALTPEISADPQEIIKNIQALIVKTSEALSKATDGRLYFEEVTLLVPNKASWPDSTDGKPGVKYSEADIIITNRDSVHSFTPQYAGCGEHALPIRLSQKLVVDSSSGDQRLNEYAKRLVHEWAHYRYGVFNEFGFPNDPLYPSYYTVPGKGDSSSEVLINSCTDDKLVYKSVVNGVNGENHCDLLVSNSTGMPTNGDCIPMPDIHNNSFESSLMYSNSVPSVAKFCGSPSTGRSHNHNVNSPNKQNILCSGRDVWDVIKSHPDLNGKGSVNPQTTRFVIRKDSTPRVLFALQNSNMIKGNRFTWLNFALKQLTTVNLHEYETALFYFDDGNPIPGSYKDWKKNQAYTLKFSLSPKESIDFVTLLTKGKEFFGDTNGGTFVVVICGQNSGIASNSDQQITKIAEELRKLNIILKIILYPTFDSLDFRRHSSQLFKTAISITGGQVFSIREKGSMSAPNQLMKAFGTIQSDYSGFEVMKYHIMNEKVFSDLKTKIEFDFTVDETLVGRQMRVYFFQSTPESNGEGVLDRTSVHVSYPGGRHETGIIDTGLGFMIGKVYTGTDIKDSMVGKWQLSANIDKIDNEETVIAIAEFSTKTMTESGIRAECWLNTDVQYDTSSKQPLLAYVNVIQGYDGLVSDVTVELVVTNEQGSNGKSIPMLDNGAGDPDITKGDGIYSQYIIPQSFESIGYYTITALITGAQNSKMTTDFGSTSLSTSSDVSSCCGSKLDGTPKALQTNYGFSRVVECGSVFVPNEFTQRAVPPNSVKDLRIENVDYDNRTVYLRWTAPGGDYTFGSVKDYKIKAFKGKDDDSDLRREIVNDFDSMDSAYIEVQNVVKAVNDEDSYGKEHRSQVKILSESGGVYYLALKAYDSASDGSVVSNIVMAYIKSNVKIQSTTAFNDVSSAPVGPFGGDGSGSGLPWWAILSICVGAAVVLLVVILIIICFVGKRRRKTDEADAVMPTRRAPEVPPRVSPDVEKNASILMDDNSLTHSVEKIPNININGFQTNNAYDSGSHHNIQPLNVNALSPVQSWDAKDLLSHWGRVQEAKSRHEPPPVMRVEEMVDSGSSNRSQSYASSDDDNNIYTNPNTWRYQDVTARPTYIPNGNFDPIYRPNDSMRSDTPSDTVPRIYSTINRKPTQNVSQV